MIGNCAVFRLSLRARSFHVEFATMLLKDRVCIITGAARGIGSAIADAFSREGAVVVATYYSSKEYAEKLRSQLGCCVYRLDVRKLRQCRALVAKVMSQFHKIDVLVNNASLSVKGIYNAPFEQIRESDWSAVLSTDLGGTFNMLKSVIPTMKRQKSGSIINFTSSAALEGDETCLLYAAAKSAVAYVTKGLGKQLAPAGVRVNAISPGSIRTDWVREWGLSSVDMKDIEASIPMKRLGEPSEIAGAAVFLASDMSSYMTGQVICVDGGVC